MDLEGGEKERVGVGEIKGDNRKGKVRGKGEGRRCRGKDM